MHNNRNELNDEVFKKNQPQNAKLARAHVLPNTAWSNQHNRDNPLFRRKLSQNF